MNGQRYDIPLNTSGNNVPMQVGEAINIYEGTHDYETLENKPQINSVELIGNKSFDDLGMSALSNMDIFNILNR